MKTITYLTKTINNTISFIFSSGNNEEENLLHEGLIYHTKESIYKEMAY